jgi:TetR/AcrR family transcriptional repressor of mexJK operon
MPQATVAPAEILSRSAYKHQAILDAAESVFLKSGYLGTNMDELAALSGVSKQTIYKHFGNKETLFVEMVTSMTNAASDRVHNEVPDPVDASQLEAYLVSYAERQLSIVMTARLLQLRRLVIGEVGRFPALASALYDSGPRRSMATFAAVLTRLAGRNLLEIEDAAVAASQFNWLVMSGPLNEAMLLGDAAIPSAVQLGEHARQGVRAFLAAHGVRP